MDWPERFAEELSRVSGEDAPLAGLDRVEVGAMLRLSREVAHRTERRWAPVSTYVVGRFVTARLAAGVPLEDALAEAERIAQGLLPPPPAEEPA
jgi:Domain of unknown function (DUF6457)